MKYWYSDWIIYMNISRFSCMIFSKFLYQGDMKFMMYYKYIYRLKLLTYPWVNCNRKELTIVLNLFIVTIKKRWHQRIFIEVWMIPHILLFPIGASFVKQQQLLAASQFSCINASNIVIISMSNWYWTIVAYINSTRKTSVKFKNKFKKKFTIVDLIVFINL